MKQQDWIDFFQAVNGRNPSIQEMAEAAQKASLSEKALRNINNLSKQTNLKK